MIDAYTIGITLALNNGVTEGIIAIRRDLHDLDKAVQSSSAGLMQLRVLAGSAVAGATAEMARLLATTSRAMAQIPRQQPQATQSPPESGAGEETQSRLAPQSVSPAVPTQVVSPVSRTIEPVSAPLSRTLPAPMPTPVSAAPSPRADATFDRPSVETSDLPIVAPRAAVTLATRVAAAVVPPAPIPTVLPVSPAPVLNPQVASPAVVPHIAPTSQRSLAGEALSPPRPEFDYGAFARELSPAFPSSLPGPKSVRSQDTSQATLPPLLPQSLVVVPPRAEPQRRETATEPMRVSPATIALPSAAPAPPSAGSHHTERHRIESVIAAPVPSIAPVGATTAPERMARPLPSVAPQQSRAAPPPAKAELILDGASLGRWMDQRLARAVSRPPSGVTGFDPRLTPVWSGASIGN
jgi:hypothetical protein